VEGEGAGAGGVAEADVGVVWGSRVGAGVIKGDAVGTGLAATEGWGSGVEVRGDTVASGNAVGAGEGVLAGWAGGAGGCCSHALTAKLMMAMRTMRYLFMPIIPTHHGAGYSSGDEKGLKFKHCARSEVPSGRFHRDRSVWLRILNPSPARTDHPHSWSSRWSAIADRPCGRMRIG
jgi:hypothetical protein